MTTSNIPAATAGGGGTAAAAAATAVVTPSSEPPEHGNASSTHSSSKNRSNKKQQQDTNNNDDGDQHITRGPRVVKKADRILITGRADYDQCDNQVISARYTLLSFFPLVRCKFFFGFEIKKKKSL